MHDNKGNLIIDAGNTLVKVVEVQDDEVKYLGFYSFSEINNLALEKKAKNYSKIILSSVRSLEDTRQLINFFNPTHVLGEQTKLPFNNKYISETLGSDRKANAAFAHQQALLRMDDVLIVDIGSCIKFDFVNAKGEYLGGSISPGLKMRYKSMHDYTGRLPLLSNNNKTDLIGNTTETSMWSGVVNGIKAEISAMVMQYKSHYPRLTTFMTGGDAYLFDIDAKNYIFVNENLTLLGLNLILEHNAK